MDFDKIKTFAKKATEKTADGISSMNEMRKKLLKKQRFHSETQRFERRSTDNIISVFIQILPSCSNLKAFNLRALLS